MSNAFLRSILCVSMYIRLLQLLNALKIFFPFMVYHYSFPLTAISDVRRRVGRTKEPVEVASRLKLMSMVPLYSTYKERETFSLIFP